MISGCKATVNCKGNFDATKNQFSLNIFFMIYKTIFVDFNRTMFHLGSAWICSY